MRTNDHATLSNNFVALSISNHRSLSERMHLFELLRREVIRLALVVLDLVRDLKLLEQPKHTLRARVIQVVLRKSCYLPE